MFKRILTGVLAAIVASVAFGADVKISAEPAMSALGATDIFLGNQGGVTGTATAAQIATYVMAAPPAGGFGSTTPRPVAATTISATGAITSTLATGTAPLTVASTTVVANLNASSLSGATFANPGVIGTTPAIVHGTNVTSAPAAVATTDAGNVGYTLISGGVPFIFNTCTLNATGAISACASMPSTYANAYMFFNASILAAAGNGSAAGFYYVQMSSATAGQACQTAGVFTLYSSGSPVIPASCSAPASGVAVGANTIPGTIMQGPAITLAAHAMGLDGSVECDTSVSQTSSANVRTMTLKFGTTSILIAPTTAVTFSTVTKIVNAGSESAQVQNQLGNNATTLGLFTTAVTRATVNTGAAVSMSWNETMNTNTEFAVIERYACKVWPN